MLAGLGRLWTLGVDIDWQAHWAGEPRRRVVLPGYQFERQRFEVPTRRVEEAAAQPPGEAAVSIGTTETEQLIEQQLELIRLQLEALQ